jgi:hypothetical protein
MITITVRIPTLNPSKHHGETHEEFVYHYEENELKRKRLEKDGSTINLIKLYATHDNNLYITFLDGSMIVWAHALFWIVNPETTNV